MRFALSKALQNGFRIGELHHVEPSLNSVTGPAGTTRLETEGHAGAAVPGRAHRQVVPRNRLIRTVWRTGSRSRRRRRVQTRGIGRLRRVFGDDVKNPRFIQTIPKSGYRLMAPVSFTSPDDGFAHAETERAPIRPRASLRSWKGAWRRWRSLPPFCWSVSSPADGHAALCQSRPLGPAHVYRAGQLAIDRGGVLPSARDRRRARVLHADDREPLHARTVLNRRRGGRHHPHAVQSARSLNVSPDGLRLLVRDFDRRSWKAPCGDSRRRRRTASPRRGRGPRRRLVSRREADRLCPRRGVVHGRQRREPAAKARDDARPCVLGALVPGRRALAIHGHESAGVHAALWEVSAEGHGLRPVPWAVANTTWTAAASGVRTGGISFSGGSVTTGQTSGPSGADGPLRRENHRPARVTSGPLLFPRASRPGTAGGCWSSAANRGARTCGSIPARANSRVQRGDGGPDGSHSRETDSGWPTSRSP